MKNIKQDNREIKFRWFGLEDKKMHYFDLFGCQSSWMIPDQEASEVMQFTGLLDRDGKEIYEKDVIEIGGVKRQVLYNQGDFVTTRQYKEPYSYRDLWQDYIVCKVIGNVFENPKLLINKTND